MAKHQFYECKGGHDYPGCMFCDGGLASCIVCGGFEGSLSTDCPGARMNEVRQDDVYAGRIDYRDGRGWVKPDGTGHSMGDTDIRVTRRQREENHARNEI